MATALKRYWPNENSALQNLKIPFVPRPQIETLPPAMTWVKLPEWSLAQGDEPGLLVPQNSILPGDSEAWLRTDWWSAADWYLHCRAEREYEKQHGPIHSNRFRLRQWDTKIWSRAWVNRIALFLREWALREGGTEASLGPLPQAELILTHDVDAVHKTLAIRFKQAAFKKVNAFRSLLRGDFAKAAANIESASRFFFLNDHYWNFEAICHLEEHFGVRSHFNFYAGWTGHLRSPRAALFDPGYNILAPRLVAELRTLSQGGWTLGLHPAFGTWAQADAMRAEKNRLEQAAGQEVKVLRQHWLRFSFLDTWAAQEAAGFALDTTLGFNDAPGFRNGAAIAMHPLNPQTGLPLRLQSVPLVLMDSHLYDYGDLDANGIAQGMAGMLDEVRAVRGIASVVWHQQAFGRDYHWGPGYKALLEHWARPAG